MRPTRKKRPGTSEKSHDVTHTRLTQALATANAINELQEKRREEEHLKASIQERKQELERLQKCIEERQDQRLKSHTSYEMFLKHQDAETACTQAVEEAKTQAVQRKEQLKQLKEEKAELLKRKHKLNHQLQKVFVYSHVMEQMVKLTEFSDAEMLADCLERQLDLRERLLLWAGQKREQMDQSDLVKMEEVESEALIWIENVDNIQKSLARKTNEMVNIKKAIEKIYNLAGGKSEKDPKKQLNEIKLFITINQDKMQKSSKDESGSKPTQTLSCPNLNL